MQLTHLHPHTYILLGYTFTNTYDKDVILVKQEKTSTYRIIIYMPF